MQPCVILPHVDSIQLYYWLVQHYQHCPCYQWPVSDGPHKCEMYIILQNLCALGNGRICEWTIIFHIQYIACISYQPVSLLNFPSEQGTQSKQHTGWPFFLAVRVPGGQLSLHTDWGGCKRYITVIPCTVFSWLCSTVFPVYTFCDFYIFFIYLKIYT